MSDLTNPVRAMRAVTLSDSTVIESTRGVYLGVGGDLKVTSEKGDVVTLKNLVGGVWHPMRVTSIWSTGTTATDVVAGY